MVSCQTNDKKAKDNPPAMQEEGLGVIPDSFSTRELYTDPSIQEGTLLDTTRLDRDVYRIQSTIVLPKISEQNSLVYKYVDSLKRRKITLFYDMSDARKYIPADSMEHEVGWYSWIRPLSVYKTDKVISLAFESGEGLRDLSSGFEFKTFNYDSVRKKRLFFADYFKLKTVSDTVFWANIISRSVQIDASDTRRFLQLYGDVDFAFDKDNVYFLFEKYHILTRGIGAVRREYVIDHIRDEYR